MTQAQAVLPAVPYEHGAVIEASKPSAEPSALDRLTVSRLRVRTELMVIAHPPAKPSLLSGDGALEGRIKSRFLDMPWVGLTVHAIQEWWADHPARSASVVATRLAGAAARPLVERYPLGVLAASAAAGAAVIAIRPWRWIFRPGLLLGVAAEIGMHQFKRKQSGSWLDVLASMTRRPG